MNGFAGNAHAVSGRSDTATQYHSRPLTAQRYPIWSAARKDYKIMDIVINFRKANYLRTVFTDNFLDARVFLDDCKKESNDVQEPRLLNPDAPDRKGQGVDLAIEEASKNMLYELTRYAWRNLSPMYEDEALQIIQRYLSVFAKTPLPPSGG